MLVALLSLLLVLGFIRFAIWCAQSFMAWLGKGHAAHWLKDGDYLEAETAEHMKKAFERIERDTAKEMVGSKKHLTREERWALDQAHRRVRDAYLNQLVLKWYQIVVIFLVASVLGLIIEEIWMFVTEGLTQSRVGLVWGPYSPIYGFGAVLLTLVFWKLRRTGAKRWQTFLAAAFVGGVLEQVTGWSMETFLGASSWDYSAVPFALSKWMALPFLIFWGLLGLIWAEQIMPELLFRIGMPTSARQAAFITLLALYLAADIFMTVSCFGRMAARDEGIPPSNAFEEWIDENYTDQFIAARFQNLVLEGAGR